MKQHPAPLGILRRLLGLAWPERKWIALGTFFLVIGSSSTLIYPQAIRLVIDQALEDRNLEAINQTAFWLLVIFAIQGLSVSLRYFIYTYTGERIVNRLRSDLFESITGREIGFFDVNRTGELLSRITTDTTVIQNTVTVNISMLLRNLIVAIGGMAFLFYHSGRLSLLIFIIVPPVALGTVYFGRKIRKTARKSQDALAEANQVAEECLGSIRTVRSFSAEPHENQRYRTALDRALLAARRRMSQIAFYQGISTFAGSAVIALVLWYGGHLVLSDAMTMGALASYLLYTIIVAFSLAALGSLWTDFMRAGGAGERVFEIIDSRLEQDKTAKKLSNYEGNISFEDIHFHYPSRPDVPVLDGVDFQIEVGETIALVGPSGSGKSTITNLILGFYAPVKGRIIIDQIDQSKLDLFHFRRDAVAIVSQEPVLFSESILENIRYGRPEATLDEIRAAAEESHAMEFIEQFPEGFNTKVGERGIQLSGGQKQRIAIARAILKNPSLLILDEATSALDTQSEALVKEALNRLTMNRTTLIIAHRLSTVKDASCIFVLDKGRIVQKGHHSILLQDQDGLYAQLIKNQILGME